MISHNNISHKPYLGSTPIAQAWLGDELIYPEGPDYFGKILLKDGNGDEVLIDWTDYNADDYPTSTYTIEGIGLGKQGKFILPYCITTSGTTTSGMSGTLTWSWSNTISNNWPKTETWGANDKENDYNGLKNTNAAIDNYSTQSGWSGSSVSDDSIAKRVWVARTKLGLNIYAASVGELNMMYERKQEIVAIFDAIRAAGNTSIPTGDNFLPTSKIVTSTQFSQEYVWAVTHGSSSTSYDSTQKFLNPYRVRYMFKKNIL